MLINDNLVGNKHQIKGYFLITDNGALYTITGDIFASYCRVAILEGGMGLSALLWSFQPLQFCDTTRLRWVSCLT